MPILGSLLKIFYHLLHEASPWHCKDRISQHQAIFTAIKARDGETAEKAMANHIQKSWDYLNARKKEWISR
jgi:DNA-binding GntR family transcriptional regulator